MTTLLKLVHDLNIRHATQEEILAGCDAAKILRTRLIRESQRVVKALERQRYLTENGGGESDDEFMAEFFGEEEELARKRHRRRHRHDGNVTHYSLRDAREEDFTHLTKRRDFLMLADMKIMNVVLPVLVKHGIHNTDTILPQYLKLVAALTVPIPTGSQDFKKQVDALAAMRAQVANDAFMGMLIQAATPLTEKRQQNLLTREEANIMEVVLTLLCNLLKGSVDAVENVVGLLCRTHVVEFLLVILHQNSEKKRQIDDSAFAQHLSEDVEPVAVEGDVVEALTIEGHTPAAPGEPTQEPEPRVEVVEDDDAVKAMDVEEIPAGAEATAEEDAQQEQQTMEPQETAYETLAETAEAAGTQLIIGAESMYPLATMRPEDDDVEEIAATAEAVVVEESSAQEQPVAAAEIVIEESGAIDLAANTADVVIEEDTAAAIDLDIVAPLSDVEDDDDEDEALIVLEAGSDDDDEPAEEEPKPAPKERALLPDGTYEVLSGDDEGVEESGEDEDDDEEEEDEEDGESSGEESDDGLLTTQAVKNDDYLNQLAAERKAVLEQEGTTQLQRWNFLILEATMVIFRTAPAANLASAVVSTTTMNVSKLHSKMSESLRQLQQETESWRSRARARHGATATNSVLVRKNVGYAASPNGQPDPFASAPLAVLGTGDLLLGENTDPLKAIEEQDQRKRGRFNRRWLYRTPRQSTLSLPTQMLLGRQFAEFIRFGFGELTSMLWPAVSKRIAEAAENAHEASLAVRAAQEDGPMIDDMDEVQLGDTMNYLFISGILLRYTRETIREVLDYHRELQRQGKSLTEQEAMELVERINELFRAVSSIITLDHFNAAFQLLNVFAHKRIRQAYDIVTIITFLAELFLMLVHLIDGDISEDPAAKMSASALASSLMYSEENIRQVLALVGDITFRGASSRVIESHMLLVYGLFLVMERVAYNGALPLPKKDKRGKKGDDTNKDDDNDQGEDEENEEAMVMAAEEEVADFFDDSEEHDRRARKAAKRAKQAEDALAAADEALGELTAAGDAETVPPAASSIVPEEIDRDDSDEEEHDMDVEEEQLPQDAVRQIDDAELARHEQELADEAAVAPIPDADEEANVEDDDNVPRPMDMEVDSEYERGLSSMRANSTAASAKSASIAPLPAETGDEALARYEASLAMQPTEVSQQQSVLTGRSASISLIDDHDMIMSEGGLPRERSTGGASDHTQHSAMQGSSVHSGRSMAEREAHIADWVLQLSTPKYVNIFLFALRAWRTNDIDVNLGTAYFLGKFREHHAAQSACFNIQFLMAFNDILHNEATAPAELFEAADQHVFDFFNPKVTSSDLPAANAESLAVHNLAKQELGSAMENGRAFEVALRCVRCLVPMHPTSFNLLDTRAYDNLQETFPEMRETEATDATPAEEGEEATPARRVKPRRRRGAKAAAAEEEDASPGAFGEDVTPNAANADDEEGSRKRKRKTKKSAAVEEKKKDERKPKKKSGKSKRGDHDSDEDDDNSEEALARKAARKEEKRLRKEEKRRKKEEKRARKEARRARRAAEQGEAGETQEQEDSGDDSDASANTEPQEAAEYQYPEGYYEEEGTDKAAAAYRAEEDARIAAAQAEQQLAAPPAYTAPNTASLYDEEE